MEALWEINTSAKSNIAATGHPYLGKCLADFHYIGVNYKVFEGWQFIGEVFCDNMQIFNDITTGVTIIMPHLHYKLMRYTNN